MRDNSASQLIWIKIDRHGQKPGKALHLLRSVTGHLTTDHVIPKALWAGSTQPDA